MSRKTRRKLKPRHPGGQIVYTGPKAKAESEATTKAVVEKQRMQHHGLSKDKAAEPLAATAVGRLLLSGQIDRAQYDAAEHFDRVVRADQRAIGSPAPLGSAGDLERGPGHDNRSGDDEEYVERCRRDRDQYRMVRRTVLEASKALGEPLIWFALQSWILENKEDWDTLGELRIGLNALRKLFRVHEQRAA